MNDPSPPRPRWGDHLHVALVLLQTLGAVLPFVLFALVGPVRRLVLRQRYRARLARHVGEPPVEPALPDPARWAGRTLFVVAGEASGDRLLAPVVREMLRLCPGLRVRGYAGPATQAAGAALDRDLTPHAVVGVVPVMRTLPRWWRLCAEFRARLREERPDLLLTVDFPGLNVRLARWGRAAGIPTLHMVAPAVWAYGGWRLPRWRRAVDRLLALLPFEPALFQGSGLSATYVGHPLFEAPLPPPRTPAAWPGGGPCTIEVLPGSRRSELDAQVPLLLDAAARVAERLPQARFVVRLAEERHRALFEAAAAAARARPERLRVDVGRQPLEAPLLGALASSGTVTAELAAEQVPMAVCYRVSWLARAGAILFLTAPYVCLANLLAGRRIVSERVVTRRAAAARLAQDLLDTVADPGPWTRQREELGRVRQRLEVPRTAERAARAVLA